MGRRRQNRHRKAEFLTRTSPERFSGSEQKKTQTTEPATRREVQLGIGQAGLKTKPSTRCPRRRRWQQCNDACSSCSQGEAKWPAAHNDGFLRVSHTMPTISQASPVSSLAASVAHPPLKSVKLGARVNRLLLLGVAPVALPSRVVAPAFACCRLFGAV